VVHGLLRCYYCGWEGAMPVYMGIFDKPNVLNRSFRGGVTAKGFEGWMELQNFQFADARGATGPGAPAGGPPLPEVSVVKFLDASSALLFQEAYDPQPRLIVIAFVKEDKAYLTFFLQNATMSSYNSGGGGEKPLEYFHVQIH
jgi:type VI protein secretion system component Hcp